MEKSHSHQPDSCKDHTVYELSAFILPVEFAITEIDELRNIYTVDGKRGLSPHISLLYPFVKDSSSFAEISSRISAVISAQPPITVVFEALVLDEQRNMIYLRPAFNPAIEQLRAALYALWKDDELPVPFFHLTLAKKANLIKLASSTNEACQAIQKLLPLTIELSEACFCFELSKKWHLTETFPFSNSLVSDHL